MGERVKDKVILATGAGSCGPGWGNGKAAAVLYAREGAKVFAVDRNPAAAEETRAIIAGEVGECVADIADVAFGEEVAASVAACLAAFGRKDVLHNNVGIVAVSGPVETAEEDWNRVLAVNLTSMFLTCKHVLPVMEAQGSGVIINVSSIAGLRWTGVPLAAYAASKGGVQQLTQQIAAQYAPKGIHANSVVPGMINTPLLVEPLKRLHGADGLEAALRARDAACPMGRMGTAWDVAHAALFLASDEAGYISGVELLVDGALAVGCA